MVSAKERLHDLVEGLDDERAEDALAYVEHLTADEVVPREGVEGPTRQIGPPVVSWREFSAQRPRTWQEIAREQGIRPIERFEDLLGDGGPADESVDEMIATIRRWRREGGHA